MKTMKQQVEEAIAQQSELAREAAACFNLPIYREVNQRIAEYMEYLKTL